MLSIRNLKTYFKNNHRIVKAIDGISFDIPPDSMIGLVGESGSGKSVTAQSILGILPHNGWIENGSIEWQGRDLVTLSNQEMRQIRGAELALIFQNPLAALNPVFSIGSQMIETIILHRHVSKPRAKEIAIDLLKKVRIPEAEQRLKDYPHQFSMGMCQRIMIALTLSMQPQILIADEPTASLDVTIQAQILALLQQLKAEFKMSILLISHDLGVVAQNCDYILVMYLGKIVEKGTPTQIFHHPRHPYTKALIAAIPKPEPGSLRHKALLLKDEPLDNVLFATGCRFFSRCPQAFAPCENQTPPLHTIEESAVACWLYNH